ncbi:MAG: replication initiation factor domain-containing protein [Sulfuritalea sp.]|nr:replication initiation factor domain-containing protein [Sulfuritalea sp.]
MDAYSHQSDTAVAAEQTAEAAAPTPARTAQRADGRGTAAAGVPFSKTGQKINEDQPAFADETQSQNTRSDKEFDSEWVEFFTTGKKPIFIRHPIPYQDGNPNAALVDWLAFTVRPPEGESHEWVIREMQRLGLVGVVEEMSGGFAGYASKAKYEEDKIRLCLVAWGGKRQAATVYISFPGHGCARISDWAALQTWLEQYQANITRLDLAYDDFKAEQISIGQAVEWYLTGGFGAGGRMPSHRVHGDWLLGDQSRSGRTLELGSREGGKLVRIYEKGKQLGNPIDPWVRIEVEWHNQSRRIPYEALTEPGRFLAGAYECLQFLDKEQSRIATTQRAAKVSFDKAMSNGRQLSGKLVNMALEVYEGDYAEVVEQLRRDGYPARVVPYKDTIKDRPDLLASKELMNNPSQPAVVATSD